MEIICESCQKKMNVPHEKIPKDRVGYLKCPGCKNRIAVGGRSESDPPEETESTTLGELTSLTYDASEKPFDFIEEEAKTSLVCVKENETRDAVCAILESLEFYNTTAESARDALKKMRYHNFDLVAIDELFDCRNPNANGVLIFLQHLPMAIRRNIFVALLSGSHRTMDNMQAFHKSVNLIVHRKNFDDFKKILMKGMADHEFFYRMYGSCSEKILGV